MPSVLNQLKLTELSLVDKPANPLAKAPIFKRDTSKGENMEEEIKKAVEEATVELQEAVDKLKSDNEFLRKGLIENGFVIKADAIEKKAKEETIEVDGELVNKSEIPAPVLKALEAAKAEKAMVELEKRATEELPHFDKGVAVELLKFDLDEKVLEALKAADAAFEAVMSENGEAQTKGDMSDPSDKLDALVKAYADNHKVTIQKAYAEVAKTKEGKALVNEIYKKD